MGKVIQVPKKNKKNKKNNKNNKKKAGNFAIIYQNMVYLYIPMLLYTSLCSAYLLSYIE